MTDRRDRRIPESSPLREAIRTGSSDVPICRSAAGAARLLHCLRLDVFFVILAAVLFASPPAHAQVCGDGICDSSPEFGNECELCPQDCDDGDCCGNGQCDPQVGECGSCSIDCGEITCGDLFCSECELEDPDFACPFDCGGCGNGTCEPGTGEDCITCEIDCGECCGDGICDPDVGEWCFECPADCGDCCGNGTCEDAFEDCVNCPADCTDDPCCGDGFCDEAQGESCGTCPVDCFDAPCCGNGICESEDGEDCQTCPVDCAASVSDLPVFNHSFELPDIADGATASSADGWIVFNGVFGAWDPLDADYELFFSEPLPDGEQIAWSNGGTMYRTTVHQYELGYTYTLTVEVGRRNDVATWPGGSIVMNGAAEAFAAPAAGTYQTLSTSYTPQPGDSLVGNNIVITLRSYGFQANFDNVRLTRELVTNGSCINKLVCESIRWPESAGCGSDCNAGLGFREWLPEDTEGNGSDVRRTFVDYSGRLYVAGDGDPDPNSSVGDAYVVLRYDSDGVLDPTFPIGQPGNYYIQPNEPLRGRALQNVAVGPDDQLYIIGDLDNPAGDAEVVKYDETGFVSTALNDARAGDIAVNGEGYLYSTYFDLSNNRHYTRREQLNDTGAVWTAYTESADVNGTSHVAVDDQGDVYSIFSVAGGHTKVIKRNIVGETIWTHQPQFLLTRAVGMSKDHLFITGDNAIIRYDLETGDYDVNSQGGIWDGEFVDLDVRPDGMAVAIMAGQWTADPPQSWFVKKLNAGFQVEFFEEFPRSGGDRGAVAFDALGNVYAAVDHNDGGERLQVRKFSTDTSGWCFDAPDETCQQDEICPGGGCLSWEGVNGACHNGETCAGCEPNCPICCSGVWEDIWITGGVHNLIVTGGGEVITTGKSNANTWRTIRLGQAWQSAPLRAIDANLRFYVTDQSIWHPDVPVVDETVKLMPPPFSDADYITWGDFGESIGDTIDVPLIGEFGAELGFDVGGLDNYSENRANLRMEADIDAGSVDVDYPMLLQADVPGDPNYLIPGRTFQFVAGCNIDPAAGFKISPADVDLSVITNLRTTADFTASATAFGEEVIPQLFQPVILDQDVTVWSLAEAVGQALPSGEFELFGGLVEGYAKVPVVDPHATVTGPLDNCQDRDLVAEGQDVFFSVGVDTLTNILTSYFGLTTAIEYPIPLPLLDAEMLIEAAILQFTADFDLALKQRFTYTAKEPLIELLDPDTGQITFGPFTPSNPPMLTMPANGRLGFQPRVYLPTGQDNFRNQTFLVLNPQVGFDTIRTGVEVEFGPVGVGDELCVLCEDVVDGSFDIEVYDTSFELLNEQGQSPFEPVLLPPIRLIGADSPAPEISGLSRESVPMYIYTQRGFVGGQPIPTETRDAFEAFVNDTTPILIYGRRFRDPGEVCAIRAVFWIHGRELSLPTTWIDDGQILVDFPNYLRLLPGFGRFWIETDGLDGNGDPIPPSNTFDFAITLPRPSIATVDPSMFAADIDFADVILVATDNLNPRGGDSFVARRDYFLPHLANLWTNWGGFTDDQGQAVPIGDVFPEFDFDASPQRPVIVWTELDENGGPVARSAITPFGAPADSGNLLSQVPRAYWLTPKNVDIQVLSPGPGGGVSNELRLVVAAPTPVIDGLNPPSALPGSEKIRLVVHGPLADPDVVDWKGNFNAASVVRWDGQDVPTTFVSATGLIAVIDPSLLTVGAHNVTVFTPANGTEFFNSDLSDCNGSESDPDCFQASGGESNVFVFNVQYETPTITDLSPDCFEQYYLDLIPDEQELDYDLIVHGTNFGPDSVVHWNGQPRTTIFVDNEQVKAKLLPEDLQVAGNNFPVTVVNPAPQGGDLISLPYASCVNENPIPSTINVNLDGTADATSIQEAIDVAVIFPDIVEEIVVHPGTYMENLDMRGAAVHLRGTGDELAVLSTTVDAGGNGHALEVASGEGSDTVIEGLRFVNASGFDGGAVRVHSSSPTFRSCVFANSTTQVQGGGLSLIFSDSLVEGCGIVANHSDQTGGGVYAYGGSPIMINNTVADNTAVNDGGGVVHGGGGGTVTMFSTIVWDNSAPANPHLRGSVDASYSLIEGGYPGEGNIDANPLFRTPGADYRLGDLSPAIDAGNNQMVSPGVTTDLLGHPRFVDDALVPDTGVGTPPLVDMGCIERQSDSQDGDGDGVGDLFDQCPNTGPGVEVGADGCPLVIPPGDCDGSGHVSLQDYSTFWNCMAGPDVEVLPGCECTDLDNDEDTDLEDFQALQSAFGDDV
jgi:hypothetical protein